MSTKEGWDEVLASNVMQQKILENTIFNSDPEYQATMVLFANMIVSDKYQQLGMQHTLDKAREAAKLLVEEFSN